MNELIIRMQRRALPKFAGHETNSFTNDLEATQRKPSIQVVATLSMMQETDCYDTG